MSFSPECITLTYYDFSCSRYAVTWHSCGAWQPVLQIVRGAPDFTRAVTIAARAEAGSGDTVLRAVTPPASTDEEYYYRVGDGELSPVYKIHTRPASAEEFSFLYVCDSQDSVNLGAYFKSCLDDAFSVCPEIRFILHGGDIVDRGGSEMMWSEMMRFGSPYLQSVPVMPCVGNHDYWDWALLGYDHTCYRHYTLDLTPQKTNRGFYYCFDFGAAHFSVLNTGDTVEYGNVLSAAQLAWLERDLKSAAGKRKIVVMHNPLYSPGKYGSREDVNDPALKMGKQLNGLFAENGVALCLSGHDHVFSRTYPIDASGEPIISEAAKAGHTTEAEGVVHHIAGCCGNQNRGIIDGLREEYSRRLADMLAMQAGSAAYTVFTVNRKGISARYRMIDVKSRRCIAEKYFDITAPAAEHD